MDDDKIMRLNVFLEEHKTSLDILPSTQVHYLSLIDDAIQDRLSSIKAAEEVLKSQRITIRNISEDTNISRKTFYNNNLLKQYVEAYVTVPRDIISENKAQIESLQNEVLQLQEQLEKFVKRDYEIIIIRQTIETTQRLLEQKQQEYCELEAKYTELLHEKEHPTERSKCKVLTPKNGKIGSYFNPQLFD